MKNAIILGLLAAGIASAARADIPPPPDRKPKPTKTELQISFVPTPHQDGKVVMELPRTLQRPASTQRAEIPASTRTLVGGLFLSLGLIGGGLWAARRKGVGNAGVVAGIAAALAVGAASGAAWANMAPRFFEPDPRVEVVWTDQETIRLHLPRQQMAVLLDKYTNAPFRKAPGSGSQSPSAAPSGSAPTRPSR